MTINKNVILQNNLNRFSIFFEKYTSKNSKRINEISPKIYRTIVIYGFLIICT